MKNKENDAKNNKKLFKEIYNLDYLARKDMSHAKKSINGKLFFLSILIFFILAYALISIFDGIQLAGGLNGLLGTIIAAWVTLLVWVFKINKYSKDVDDYLDSLLVKYQPNNKQAYTDFINKTKNNPSDFFSLVHDWVKLEAETYSDKEIKAKKYKFTEGS